MKNKMKVYLQYPWGVADSQYYRSLIENPPKNIEYQNIRKKEGMITKEKKLFFWKNLKKISRALLNKLNLPLPNAHKSPEGDYDIIHCAHCLSKNKDKPWVADFESLWQMWISGKNTKKVKKIIRKILIRPNCKKILAWTEVAREEILKAFPEVSNKIGVVGYAMPFPKIKKIKKETITLLFVSRYFYEKGGLHALEAIDSLTKKHKNIHGIFVAPTPKGIFNKYKKNKKIEFFGLTPHDKLMNKIFPRADIFIYPGYSDTYGFLFIEALAFGLPIVTVDRSSRRELIKDKEQGFVINRKGIINPWKIGDSEQEIIKELIEKTTQLIKNNSLMKRMSENCKNEVKKGKFSIKERNKKLEKIYKEALK